MADNQSLPSLSGKVPSFPVFVDKRDYQEKSLTDEGHQPNATFSETLQDAKEESRPMTIVTSEFHSETIVGRESLPVEAEGTQTLAVDDKSHLPTDENGSTFTSAEESSYTATEGSSDVLNKDAKEPEKGTSSPAPRRDSKRGRRFKTHLGYMAYKSDSQYHPRSCNCSYCSQDRRLVGKYGDAS